MNLKKRFEHIKLPAKLLDYFFPSNKSNINQTTSPQIFNIFINALHACSGLQDKMRIFVRADCDGLDLK